MRGIEHFLFITLCLIAAGVLILSGCLLFSLRGTGLRYRWRSKPLMYKKPCKTCDGCGVVIYLPEKKTWGVIPVEIRTFKHGRGRHFQHGRANIRTCLHCHGAGFTWERLADEAA